MQIIELCSFFFNFTFDFFRSCAFARRSNVFIFKKLAASQYVCMYLTLGIFSERMWRVEKLVVPETLSIEQTRKYIHRKRQTDTANDINKTRNLYLHTPIYVCDFILFNITNNNFGYFQIHLY